ncbi:hypothetical protein ABMB44_13140 [Levilactobacillus brevis]
MFICWAVAASILAIGPSVAEKLLDMQSRGVFGYVVAVYLVIAGIPERRRLLVFSSQTPQITAS